MISVYAVTSGEKPLFVLILGIIGFLGVIGVSFYYKKIEIEIENRLEELGKEE